jgi:hypothetical protein
MESAFGALMTVLPLETVIEIDCRENNIRYYNRTD